MGAGFHGGFGGTKGSQNIGRDTDHNTEKKDEQVIPSEKELISELKVKGIKFTEEDIVFITKDKTGQTIWLEKGSHSAGLEHILNGDGEKPGHASDFENAFGITRDNIPDLLKKVISNGQVVSDTIKIKNGRQGYERIYYYDGKHYVLIGIGTNGFVVSAYPIEY